MHIGDLVVRKSYGGDVTFRIEGMCKNLVIIKGTQFRLVADSPINDLLFASDEIQSDHTEKVHIKAHQSLHKLKQHRHDEIGRSRVRLESSVVMDKKVSYFEMPGKVLHLDGDLNYLKKSMNLYEQLRVPAEGYYVEEREMAETLYRLLPKVNPNIVVITGHDGVLKTKQPCDLYNIQSYKNSQNFVAAIKAARQYERHLDALTIVAGACQSHFEALLRAGANFASSPGRILIHALDPVYIAAKAAFTSLKDTINMNDIMHYTLSGTQGVGGVETRGSYRIGLPSLNDLSTLNVTPSITS